MTHEGNTATPASDAGMSEHIYIAAASWWSRLAAAPLDTELAARFEQWMADSDLHRLAFADIASVSYAIEQLPTQATQLAPQIAARRRLDPWRSVLRAAQTLAAVVLFSLAWLNLPTWLQNLRADHHTGVAQQRQIELDDGSVLNLDSDSAVQLHFQEHRREVRLLRGTAHVQVQADSTRPFVVRAGTRQALALGTAYSVEYSSGTVTVDHGRVQVSAGDDSTHEVSAGQIAVPQGSDWLVRDDPVASQPPDWMRGQRIFVQRPLREVLRTMDRYLPGHMWLRDAPALDQPVTAILDLGDPSLALAQLCAAHGLQMRAWPGLVVIGAL